MSISSSLYTAEGALSASSISMAAIGHNIANTNTVGFKASQVDFADLFTAAQAGLQVGQGVQLAGTRRLDEQGAIETTNAPLDLAVEGAGFFILQDASGNSFYTRAGQFILDSTGTIVNPDGLALQGAGGNITIANGLTLPGQATTAVTLAVNLDPTAAPAVSPFPAGPDATPGSWFPASNFSTAFSVFDSSGAQHGVTFLFRQSGPNAWDYRVVARRNEIDPLAPTSTDLRQIGSGTLTFDSAGALTGFTGGIGAVTWVSGATNQAPALNFAGTTQFAVPSAVFGLTQDGAASGTLSRIEIDLQGNITGQFSNGRTQILDRVALANFRNPAGLDAIGDSLLAVSQDSGAATIGIAGQGGLGAVLSGALEMSNVDLPQEFVNMILTQRAFQINSRIITVADQMYTVAAGLKP
ncbi:MAG TPA: flagellar hook protein FlgE [Candidatus Binatia bacterium]|jgi:flagellar hook protein FlgE